MEIHTNASKNWYAIEYLLPRSWYDLRHCAFTLFIIDSLIYLFIGSTQGIAIIENLIEHLAKACNEDPLEFRLKNLSAGVNGEPHPIRSIIDQVRKSSELDDRKNQVLQIEARCPVN